MYGCVKLFAVLVFCAQESSNRASSGYTIDLSHCKAKLFFIFLRVHAAM